MDNHSLSLVCESTILIFVNEAERFYGARHSWVCFVLSDKNKIVVTINTCAGAGGLQWRGLFSRHLLACLGPAACLMARCRRSVAASPTSTLSQGRFVYHLITPSSLFSGKDSSVRPLAVGGRR